MKFTILGASGFIGNNLSNHLKGKGFECFCPERDYQFKKEEDLGHVVYCIGLTSDFRSKPFETIEAHVCKLKEVLGNSSFNSFLYLSSTRVYNGCENGQESSKLIVDPNDFSDLYNISKIMGESICMSIPDDKIRIVRLSNVIGNDFTSVNFLFSLIKEAVLDNKITLQQPFSICRDYIMINDVLEMIYNISTKGEYRIYNIASGKNLSNKEIISEIHKITNCEIELSEESEGLVFPEISIKRIENEFEFKPNHIINELQELILNYKNITI